MSGWGQSLRRVAVMLFIAGQAWAQTSVTDAVNSMSGLSQGALDNIQKGDPAQAVPKYTDQNANESLYGGGDVLPTDPGSNKISGCAVNPAKPNIYDRQDCESVNFVMKNRKVRPNITVTNKDPIIAGNRPITNDPRDTLEKYKWIVPTNSDGSFGNLPSGACSPTTISTPATYEERKCTFYKGSENFLCKAPLVVEVKPHFNYLCQDSSAVNSTGACSKVLHVNCINDCVALSDVSITQFSQFVHPMNITTQQMGGGVTQVTIQGSTVGGRYAAATITIGNKSNMEYIKVISSNRTLNDTRNNRDTAAIGVYPGFVNYSNWGPAVSIGQNFWGMLNNASQLKPGTNTMQLWSNDSRNYNYIMVIEYKRAAATCNQSCSESLENNCTSYEQRSR
ncbi:hypothetical protein [Hydromonas duriensis]|uniref:Conjugal transfer protein TraN n=1 Tax=Hydromonas duriensis TaxID=1527608 RepID=A0A4R6Y1M6_9BURK|nr:hypothetical protein [Hydromonas duriensis]TDR30295.1 hypothetical protein DFR44_12319 [Hydromonas duriensis]